MEKEEGLEVMRSLQRIDHKVNDVGNSILSLRERLSPLLVGENELRPGRAPEAEKMSIKHSLAQERASEVEGKLDDMLDLLGSISSRL